MSDSLPPPRYTNSLGDAIITIQLLYHTYSLLRSSPRPGAPLLKISRVFYTLNLGLASIFTFCGMLLHTIDPLPVVSTPLWKVFLLCLAATPILWPVVMATGLFPNMTQSSRVLLAAWFLLSLVFHVGSIVTEYDFSPHMPAIAFDPVVLPPMLGMPEIVLDGTSVGGRPYGVQTDLLSTVPSWSGSGVFVHCVNFTIAAVHSLVLVFRADSPIGLKVALVLMVTGQVVMLPILAVFGVRVCFDFWHVSIFTVMQLVFVNLMPMICLPEDGKKVNHKETSEGRKKEAAKEGSKSKIKRKNESSPKRGGGELRSRASRKE
jgi:hypothetical protein